MLFGEYLRRLLVQENVEAIDLAVSLNIDVSLVYRWLRHERVPRPNSNYVARIAAYLGLDQETTDALLAAQMHSLALTHGDRLAHAAHSSEASPFQSFVPASHGVAASPAVSHLPRTIGGRQQVFRTLTTLLQQLSAPVQPDDRLILTFQGEDATAGDAALEEEWRQSLYFALDRGWALAHYLRLGDQERQTTRLARDLLRLLPTRGRYLPRYFPEHGMVYPPHDLLIGPPPIDAFLLLAAEQGRHIDAALVIQHPGQVAQLRGYVRQLAAMTRPLAQAFPTDDRAAYWRALTEIGERPGHRDQIKDGLSVLTRPPGWYDEGAAWWRRHGHTAASAALWRRRVASFERHLRTRRDGYRYRDIIPQDALETYVGTGIHPSDLRADGRATPDTETERLAHLDRLLELLRSEQYELALVRDPLRLVAPGINWEVKAGQGVLMQAYCGSNGTASRTDYLIEVPTIVAGFAAVFEEQWQRLAFPERDKHTVRQLLEARRDALRRALRRQAAH